MDLVTTLVELSESGMDQVEYEQSLWVYVFDTWLSVSRVQVFERSDASAWPELVAIESPYGERGTMVITVDPDEIRGVRVLDTKRRPADA